jgi:lipoprotein-anchoring transpeptidase ErfK/SrfK
MRRTMTMRAIAFAVLAGSAVLIGGLALSGSPVTVRAAEAPVRAARAQVAAPLGVFTITQKDAHHVSNLYGAPMPYMLRLTNDGVSIHGSALMDGKYATHGCVGVPTAFAKLIFGQVKLGDRVIVTSGEMLERGGRITAA